MHSASLSETERYSASKATHPRVSLKAMEDKIRTETYINLGEALDALGQPVADGSHVRLMTLCVLDMSNGYVVVGQSAPASAENFDPEKGKRFAYENAIGKLWPLEGYALRDRLAVTKH